MKLFDLHKYISLQWIMDPCKKITKSSLQITGLFARLQNQKCTLSHAMTECLNITKNIDRCARHLQYDNKKLKTEVGRLTAENRHLRKANSALSQSKRKLNRELQGLKEKEEHFDTEDIIDKELSQSVLERSQEVPHSSTPKKSLRKGQSSTEQCTPSVPLTSDTTKSDTMGSSAEEKRKILTQKLAKLTLLGLSWNM